MSFTRRVSSLQSCNFSLNVFQEGLVAEEIGIIY
jgi:hypothetical protein